MGNDRLINFCHPNLCSTVTCSTCSSENYEETNLVSPEPAKLSRGFMADRFIKPPVQIEVTFKHSVNLSHILLWPRVGQQKSTGFEVLSCYFDRNSTTTERIGWCYLSDNEEGVFLYCARKFGIEKSDFNPNLLRFAKRSFKWQKMSAISDVKSIVIRIMRTNSSSVPALGRIEVWGQPGYRTTDQEKIELLRLWERNPDEVKPLSKPILQQPSAVPGTSKESLPSTSLEVPEEFLDGLTFEMMAVPMVLPSGKVVDQRTLERHQDSEANWGRPPSDPFTGRPFTATLHPILDTALKARIDHFLVVHQDKEELRFVPRTLGRKDHKTAKNHTNVPITQKVMFKSLNDKICVTSCPNHGLSNCTLCVPKASNIIEISPNPRKRACSPEITFVSSTFSRSKHVKTGSNIAGPVLKPSCHRFDKDDDLDDALKAVLNGLPSYINIEKTPPSAFDDCCKCHVKDNLFQLPCKHLVCRVCLLEKTKGAHRSCDVCQRNFTADQPVKYHPV